MTISNPDWPPDGYNTKKWPPKWLRYETEYPGSGRPSRLIAHNNVPYVVEVTDEQDINGVLKKIAGQYLDKVCALIGQDWEDPDAGSPSPPEEPLVPDSWREALKPVGSSSKFGTIDWLDVWPKVGFDNDAITDAPTFASWNLSRQTSNALPATIVMTAAEVYSAERAVMSYNFGVRVPMSVTAMENGFLVVTRSMTAELPPEGYISVTEIWEGSSDNQRQILTSITSPTDNELNFDIIEPLIELSADDGFLDASTMTAELLLFSRAFPSDGEEPNSSLAISSKGASAQASDEGYALRPGYPERQSYQIFSTFAFSKPLISSEVCSLVTHAAQPGSAEVFVQTPSGWIDPNDPTAEYRFTRTRPTRRDHVLEGFRIPRAIGHENGFNLAGEGFEVRLCPQYVPADIGEGVKSVNLPGGEAPLPRRNDYTAVMAYCYSQDFFQLLADIGLTPDTFVVRAQKKIEVKYRYGIFPGPGRDGRTVNAQVAFDCAEAQQGIKPKIKMRLALGTLNRWSRPETGDNRPEPLGIASSGRWMLHEFGHYLIAARLGKLEFDFAHSAGDALAAVWYDPYSRLNSTRGGVSERFRGITYPFIFSTRRHDRSPLLGWAWYGTLNRSVIANPPTECETLKGYLTEQILSTSVFNLYLALGGDTKRGNAPDDYIRYRASFMTLFLLIRAIAGFAQSPSKAEMLELGMEETGLLMTDPLTVPNPPYGTFENEAPQPASDSWAGGVTHKVVRWVFEAQGMFVDDVLETTNGPGQPMPVDIYVLDQRPETRGLPGGTTIYGRGSYAPVSLDWTGDRAWMAPTENSFTLGNRGKDTAQNIGVRLWLGVLLGDIKDQHWDFGDNIDWILSVSLPQLFDLEPADEHLVDLPTEITDSIDDAVANGIGPFVILLEISCDDDLANSNPQALLASSIADGDDPPTRPRVLTDLVACDNNLGVMFVGGD